MATTTIISKAHCVGCGNDNHPTLRCDGCLQEFCHDHLSNHRQELSQQLDKIEVTCDLFRQTLTQHTQQPDQHPLIQKINDWEQDSIKKIQQTADEARQSLFQHTNGHIQQIDVDLNKLTEQLRESRKENDFLEIDLRYWNEELNRLTKELVQPSKIYLQEEWTPLINKISVYTSSPITDIPSIPVHRKWKQNGITVAGGNGPGNELDQLFHPLGLYLNDDQTIYIADCLNHRIIAWQIGTTNGRVVAGGNGQGNQINQLNSPSDIIVDQKNDSLIICDSGNKRVMRWPFQNRLTGEILLSEIDCQGLAMDNQGYLYVSDSTKHEVRRWKIGDKDGKVVAGGNGEGFHLNQLNHPTSIFVDQNHSVYVSDVNNHRIMKWMKGAKEGIVVADSQNQGDGIKQLFDSRGIFVDQFGIVYMTDRINHQVIRWEGGDDEGSIIVGGNGKGSEANQFCNPWGMAFDRDGNLYVADNCNHRIQKFNIESRSNK